jgi:hypothetical protein
MAAGTARRRQLLISSRMVTGLAAQSESWFSGTSSWPT